MAERFGKLPLTTSMAAAIAYAREGFPVSPSVAYAWQQATKLFRKQLTDPHFQSWFDTFSPERAPEPGEIWRSAGHANTLQSIAEDGAQSFYRGALAEKIAAFVQGSGGHLSTADLAAYQVDWVTPSASTTGALTSGKFRQTVMDWWR